MEIKITAEQANQRVDKFIKRWIKEAPLSFIYKLFRQKDVKVNGKKVDIKYILQDGDTLFIYLKPDLLEKFKKDYVEKPISTPLDIIYEDKNIVVVNKPRGLLIHSDGKDSKFTLANMLTSYLIQKGEFNPNNSYGFVPGPCHRLDRNTTGIVICAKNLPAMQELLALFRDRTQIKKSYTALVYGKLNGSGTINIPLVKDADKGMVRAGTLKEGAKTAITEYKRVKQFSNTALVNVELLTGRTHQIRAHFSLIGHPVVGDGKYGNFEINKEFEDLYGLKSQFLHAATFSFLKIDGVLSYLSGMTFEAPLPDHLRKILSDLS